MCRLIVPLFVELGNAFFPSVFPLGMMMSTVHIHACMLIVHSIQTIDILPIPLYTHGLMIGIGVVMAYLLAYRRLKRLQGLSFATLDYTVLVAVLGGLVGARVFYVVLNHRLYGSIVEMLKIWEGGLVSFGGIIGGVFCGLLFLHRKRENIWKWADALVPYFFFGWGVARIGDFLSWSEIGTPTALPFGVAVDGDVPRHAAQLYTTIVMIVFFFVFRFLYKRWSEKPGLVASVAVLAYGVFRFLIEFIRDYPDNEYPFFYRYFAQIMSALFIAVGVFLLLRWEKRIRQNVRS